LCSFLHQSGHQINVKIPYSASHNKIAETKAAASEVPLA
jgi:hypothetical protein